MRTKMHQTIQSVSCLTGDVYDLHFETHLREIIRMTPYEPYQRSGVSNTNKSTVCSTAFQCFIKGTSKHRIACPLWGEPFGSWQRYDAYVKMISEVHCAVYSLNHPHVSGKIVLYINIYVDFSGLLYTSQLYDWQSRKLCIMTSSNENIFRVSYNLSDEICTRFCCASISFD